MDRISREIAFVPLGGRIRSKRSSCMKFFFFFFGMSTRHAYLKLRKYGDSSHVFQRTKRSGSWLMFLEDEGIFFFFWALTHVFREPKVLDLGSCFQKTKDFWALAHVFKEPKVLDPDSYF